MATQEQTPTDHPTGVANDVFRNSGAAAVTTFLFLWNPSTWDMDAKRRSVFYARMSAAGIANENWSSGGRRYEIGPGDRALLYKTGSRLPRGIVASGRIMSSVYEGPPLSEDRVEVGHYVDIAWDTWVPRQDALDVRQHGITINAQASGTRVDPRQAARLEELWAAHEPAKLYAGSRAVAAPFWSLVDWFHNESVTSTEGPSARFSAHDAAGIPQLLATDHGPLAIALARCYLDLVEPADETWSLSCMPGAAQGGTHRAFTLSIGDIEAAWVSLDITTGRICEWCASAGSVDSLTLARLDVDICGNREETYLTCDDGLAFLSLMSDPTGSEMLRVGAAELSKRVGSTPPPGRADAAFAHLVLTTPKSDIEDELSYWGDADEVEARYTLALSRHRLHQQKFKEILLKHQPHQCAVCGFDRVDLLEAAHLVPDSEGGPSSTDNGRLMCPNHHRAHDRGYFRFEGDRVVWSNMAAGFGRPGPFTQ